MAEMACDDAVFSDLLCVFTLLVPDGSDNHACAVAQRKLQARIIDTLTGNVCPCLHFFDRVEGERDSLRRLQLTVAQCLGVLAKDAADDDKQAARQIVRCRTDASSDFRLGEAHPASWRCRTQERFACECLVENRRPPKRGFQPLLRAVGGDVL